MSTREETTALPSLAAEWLAEVDLTPARVEPLTGDVSLRRYFRLHYGDRPSAVLSFYPPDLRPVCRRFVNTTSLLDKADVPVPRLLATHCDRGLSVIEDAGDVTLYTLEDRDWGELEGHYRDAASYIPRFAGISTEVVGAINPRLDAALLEWELGKTWTLFLEPSGMLAEAATATALREGLTHLCWSLGDPVPVPCHRDYMPRNLMVTERGLLVLDHQDLRLGPPGYDLASLLNDSLFPPAELEEELLATYMPGAAGRAAYGRAVVQRSLKAIGNYVDFAMRGFDRHLRLVGPTLARALRWFPEVAELAHAAPRVLPAWQERLHSGSLLDWLEPSEAAPRQED
jgi:N-acetylmuramate 1-kinase